MTVRVTQKDFSLGRPGPFAGPISLALARALGPDPTTGNLPLVAVDRGPRITPILDARSTPEYWPLMTTWFARLGGRDVPLPRRCQTVLNVFGYGPGGTGALYAVRDRAGRVLALRPYAEIVVPFEFNLPLEGA